MAANFTDFNEFGVCGKKIKQCSRKVNNLCQKIDIWLKNLQKLPKFLKKLQCYLWCFWNTKMDLLTFLGEFCL